MILKFSYDWENGFSDIKFWKWRKKGEREQIYGRLKFCSIRDTIPHNFVTQLLFPTKFTFVC